MIHGSPEAHHFASMSFNQSIVEKSIINHLPDSTDYLQKIHLQHAEIERLRGALQKYGKIGLSKFPPSKQQILETARQFINQEVREYMVKSAQAQGLKNQNLELKTLIKKLSEELRFLKLRGMDAAQKGNLQQTFGQIQRFMEENLRLGKQLRELEVEVYQLRKINQKSQEFIKLQTAELEEAQESKSQRKIENQSKRIQQLMVELDDYRRQILSLRRQIDQKEQAYDKLVAMNREGRKADRSGSRFRDQGAQSRVNSEFQILQGSRWAMKLSEKNKEYEQLYQKYQILENDYEGLQEHNRELERQRRFLSDRLSDMEIHTEGDEVTGELENRLVLMSTEIMRLGNLGRGKTQQNKDLNLRVKQLIHKKEHLQKQIIEKDKLLFNYKEQTYKYDQLIRQIQHLKASELTLKHEISNYEEKLAMVAQQNERLSYLLKNSGTQIQTLEKFKLEIDTKEKKVRQLSKQVDSLSSRQIKRKQQIESLRQKLRNAFIHQQEIERRQFMNRQLRDELEGARTQIGVKGDQLSALNQRYQRQMGEKYELVMRVEELKAQLAKCQRYNPDTEVNEGSLRQSEAKKLIQKARTDQARIKQLQYKDKEKEEIYDALSGEIQRLNIVLGEKMGQIVNLSRQNDLLQHKVRTCQETLSSRKYIQFSSQKSIAQVENKTRVEMYQSKLRSCQGQLQLLRQRCSTLRQACQKAQIRAQQLIGEKTMLQGRICGLEMQLTQRSEGFRHVEDSFKLTILEIKNSNERLQKSLRQIENHYIAKLDNKDQECSRIRIQKNSYEKRINELQKRISYLDSEYGQEIRQKDRHIFSLNTNQSQSKQEIESIRKIKADYQMKLALLSQEVERLNQFRDQKERQIGALRLQIKENDNRFNQSMRESTANVGTIDILSQEIERLNSVLVKHLQSIRRLQKQVTGLERQKEELIRQVRQAKSMKEEYHNLMSNDRDTQRQQIIKIQETNRQLKFSLQSKISELDSLERKLNLKQQRLAESQQRAVTADQRSVIFQQKLIATQQRLMIAEQKLLGAEQRQQGQANNYMKNVLEEIKQLRQGNQNMQQKMSLILRQNQQLVGQVEQFKRAKSIHEGDQKMKIINNYQATIRHIKEQHSLLTNQKERLRIQNSQLNKISHEMQQRIRVNEEKYRRLEQKCRIMEDKCRVAEQKWRIAEESMRLTEERVKSIQGDKMGVEQKLFSASEQITRLQFLIKTKEKELMERKADQGDRNQAQYYEIMKDKKGIFVIKQVSEIDERSRSASGNGPQPAVRTTASNQNYNDLIHRYELLESVNKKITHECECLRKKAVEYQFKMNKLKEEFQLINRLIQQYRQENDKLKENNKLLVIQHRSNNHHHSNFSSPQQSTFKPHLSPEPSRPPSHLSPAHRQRETSRISQDGNTKIALIEEIDRLNRVNTTLQSQVHDLRLNSTDNISLRKRIEENMGLLVILFAQIESLRMRLWEGERRERSPPKPRT